MLKDKKVHVFRVFFNILCCRLMSYDVLSILLLVEKLVLLAVDFFGSELIAAG